MRKDAIRAYAEQRRIGWEAKAKRVVHPAWVCFAVVKGAPNAYYHREKKKWVIGGAPGKPPRSQSGTLRGNIRFALTTRGTYIIGPTTTAWYGRMHEFGLQTKTGKVKRPFMRPALYRTIYKFTDFFKGMDLGKTRAGRHLARARRMKGGA